MVGEMIENKVKPSNMLRSLKIANPSNLTKIRQVCNERTAYLKAKRISLTEM